MANILSPVSKKNNERMYRQRFISIVFFLISVLVFVAIALTIPRFILVHSRAQAARKIIIEHSDTASSSVMKKEVDRKIQKTLEPDESMNVVGLIDEIEKNKPDSIFFTAITFGKNELKVKDSKPKIEYVMSVSGISNTRESLVLLKERIEKIDRILNVDLPVSQLAKNTDIEFSLTFSIKPLP